MSDTKPLGGTAALVAVAMLAVATFRMPPLTEETLRLLIVLGALWAGGMTAGRLIPEEDSRDLVTACLVFLIVLPLYFAGLAPFPSPSTPDEGVNAGLALQLGQEGIRGPVTHRRVSEPVLPFWVQSLCMRVLGENLFALRAPSAMAGAATAAGVFLLARLYLPQGLSLLAASAVATLPVSMMYFRLAETTGLMGPFMVFSLLTLIRGRRDGSRRLLILSGFLAGVGIHTYLPFMALAGGLSLWLFLEWVFGDIRRDARRDLAAFLLGEAAPVLLLVPGALEILLTLFRVMTPSADVPDLSPGRWEALQGALCQLAGATNGNLELPLFPLPLSIWLLAGLYSMVTMREVDGSERRLWFVLMALGTAPVIVAGYDALHPRRFALFPPVMAILVAAGHRVILGRAEEVASEFPRLLRVALVLVVIAPAAAVSLQTAGGPRTNDHASWVLRIIEPHRRGPLQVLPGVLEGPRDGPLERPGLEFLLREGRIARQPLIMGFDQPGGRGLDILAYPDTSTVAALGAFIPGTRYTRVCGRYEGQDRSFYLLHLPSSALEARQGWLYLERTTEDPASSRGTREDVADRREVRVPALSLPDSPGTSSCVRTWVSAYLIPRDGLYLFQLDGADSEVLLRVDGFHRRDRSGNIRSILYLSRGFHRVLVEQNAPSPDVEVPSLSVFRRGGDSDPSDEALSSTCIATRMIPGVLEGVPTSTAFHPLWMQVHTVSKGGKAVSPADSSGSRKEDRRRKLVRTYWTDRLVDFARGAGGSLAVLLQAPGELILMNGEGQVMSRTSKPGAVRGDHVVYLDDRVVTVLRDAGQLAVHDSEGALLGPVLDVGRLFENAGNERLLSVRRDGRRTLRFQFSGDRGDERVDLLWHEGTG